ncbi:hypothetical protein [Actinokineospora globicatena]|uniref:hypothetical protein n=1 Tax=Actinokineospora globicatena TaxID=103729 RepID=UPI0020A42629|nr:hypothetical protein [Actinokineospora globicatena]MCP2306089.1 hypothetical protein [Actinokineospora globicatena]GLW80037.1 hypothetical protein Aglo01_45180 [Actinokineospora globicatena]GLW86866.1 hypothetical protein Aglo02_45050 [Actinokineospora globicatena]
MNQQLDMFATPDTPPIPTPAPAPAVPGTRSRKQRPMRPQVAADVLAEIHHGKLGALDDSDRIVVFEDDDRVRVSLDEDTALHLLAQHYIERGPARDRVSCLHGVIRKPVTPLRLTKTGHALLKRWSVLHPL